VNWTLLDFALAAGFIGAFLARRKPKSLSRAMFAAALAMLLAAIIAVAFEAGHLSAEPAPLATLTGFFAGFWLMSAWLFWTAARES
jgi:hypothetical protein